ncbi:nucleotide-diphospho-sugar transferase [Gymnopus androsaceus JB14]|uniref:Nucleotide-diphospho-sugar transferase n=1 Tax=Gymnopus androsaceus JB14 TaxID=1447944 RepID=A0A6A4INK9_9AGAR|nr:nucleotide-diphospho-sugar transferase [Gymnopus androsaceus JB14]
MSRRAYVTLLTKNNYLPGVLVLAHGFKATGAKYPLVVMVTPSLEQNARDVLEKCNIEMYPIEGLLPDSSRHAVAEHDARFKDTWTKLRAFELEGFERIVLLDADMLIKRSMDELFDLPLAPDEIAAVHVCACNPMKYAHYPADWIPQNCAHTAVQDPFSLPPTWTPTSPRPYGQLNSGTVVLNPSPALGQAIVHYLNTENLESFAFPDQDLLTAFFKGKWKPLPWYYNALKPLRLVHSQMWRDDEVRCLHYIFKDKPWETRTPVPGPYEEVHVWWWKEFDSMMEELDPDSGALVLSLVDTSKTAN